MWKTGGLDFPSKKDWWKEAHPTVKQKAMLKKCRLSAVATPNREKPKGKKEEKDT